MAPTLRVRRAATFDKPVWSDIAQIKNEQRKGSLFLDLPSKILDQILSDSDLNLRDHLALAATKRSLRSCYSTTPSIWSALIALRPLPSTLDDVDEDSYGDLFEHFQSRKDAEYRQPENVRNRRILSTIWSGKDADTSKKGSNVLVDASNRGERVETGKKRDLEEMEKDSVAVVRSAEWEEAITLVHEKTIGKSDAMKRYRLTDLELVDYLQATLVGKQRQNGSQPSFFIELAVQALAYRLHGGVLGHKALMEKKKNAAKKMRETKRKNGTAGVWVFTGRR